MFNKSASSTVEFTGLKAGRTYYVLEVKKNGEVLDMDTIAGVAYFPMYVSEGAVTVDVPGKVTVSEFTNVFSETPEGFFKEGELTVTKKVLGADKKPMNTNEKFYVGIFDADTGKLSTRVHPSVLELTPGGKATATATAVVDVSNEDLTLLIEEVADQKGTALDESTFSYKVSYDLDEVIMSTVVPEESVTVTNTLKKQKADPTPTPTQTPKPTKTPTDGDGDDDDDEYYYRRPTTVPETVRTNYVTSGSTGGGSSVVNTVPSSTTTAYTARTGDDTPIVPLIILLMAAAAVVMLIMTRRRKNQQ